MGSRPCDLPRKRRAAVFYNASHMMKPHILLWAQATAPYVEAVKAAGLYDRVNLHLLPPSEKPSADVLAQAEVVMTYNMPAGVLGQMPKLRWAQAMMAGVENWLALPDLPPNVVLTCARGTHEESMPENIVGALFYVAKPYAAAVENQKQRKWVRMVPEPLTGKTLGILGVGVIGQKVARIASTLGMRVIGTRRRPEAVEGVQILSTGDVLAQSDFVLLLLPATRETENFVDKEKLSRMKPTAWLLNFGRGPSIKDEDLVAAAKEKRIAGAILDVYRQEPLPAEHPFWTTPGIIVLPHLGGPHPQRDKFVARLFVDNLARFLDGKPLREVVDRTAGY
jgi:phosphoglycerate dehydrogenase-like enzyme